MTASAQRLHIYLAAPYRGTPAEIQERMGIFSRVCRLLRLQGHFVTTPLLHHYTFDGADIDGDYWLEYSEELLRRLLDSPYTTAALYLLQLPGWDKSSGVAKELSVAAQHGIPVYIVDKDANVVDGSHLLK